MKRPVQDLSSWSQRPLCRRYVLGIFDTAIVRLRHAGQATQRPVHWAFGGLLDGESEPLGAWMAPASGEDASPGIVADLQWRGVERIWHVTGGAAAPVRAHVSAALSGTSVFSAGERSQAVAPVAARPTLASPAQLAAETARNELVRALRRHGGFESEAAALDFIHGALQRRERRLERASARAKGMPRPGSGAHTVPPGF